jgi:MYXO-CTERM domain-containing protein
MFVLVLAVPALLVVVLGYVVGSAVWAWATGLLAPGLASGAEPAGWITGLLLLVAVVRVLLVRRRRQRGVDSSGRNGAP